MGGADRTNALGSAHALLHLINFDEPFGLSVVEALACGTPVIAADRGGAAELVTASRAGLTFRAGDAGALAGAVQRCYAADRDALGARGVAYIRGNHTWDHVLGRIAGVYREVVPC